MRRTVKMSEYSTVQQYCMYIYMILVICTGGVSLCILYTVSMHIKIKIHYFSVTCYSKVFTVPKSL